MESDMNFVRVIMPSLALAIALWLAIGLLLFGAPGIDSPAVPSAPVSTPAEDDLRVSGGATPLQWIAEDDPRWDCRIHGNRVCGVR